MKFFLVCPFSLLCFIVSSCTTPSILTTKELNLGNEYSNKNDFRNAIIHYKNFLDRSVGLGKYRNFVTEAEVFRNIAHAYSTFGQYDKTVQCLKSALYLDSLGNNTNELAKDYSLLGMAKAYSNSFDEALQLLQKAMTLSKNFNTSPKNDKQNILADVNLSLAQIYTAFGAFVTSTFYVQKSLHLYNRTSDSEGKIQALKLLAWLQVEDCNYSDAEINLKKSIELSNKLKIPTYDQYGTLGDICKKKGQYEAMLRYKLQSLEQAESSNILPQIVCAKIEVGDSYMLLGMNDMAKRYYLQANQTDTLFFNSNLKPSLDFRVGDSKAAFKSFLKNGMKYGEGISSLKIAEIYKSINTDSVLYYSNHAFEVFNDFNNREYSFKAQLQISEVLIEQGKTVEALSFLLPASKATLSNETLWRSQFLVGQAYEKSNLVDSAICFYKKSINVIEGFRSTLTLEEFRDSYFSDKVIVYDKLIQLLQNRGDVKEAWSYTEQARARCFLDMVAGKKVGGSQSADSALIVKEQRLKSELNYLQSTIQAEVLYNDSSRALSPILDIKYKEKEAEYFEIIEQLKLFKSKYIQLISAKTVSLDQLQKKINKNQCLIEYWCGKDNLLIYLVSKDTLISRKIPIDALELKSKVELLRKSINTSEDLSLLYLKELYDILWKPVEHEVSGHKDICIVPHQFLHYLPFSALFNEKFLIERYLIHNSISATLFKEDVVDGFDGHLLGLALNKSNVGNFKPLQNTAQEIKLVQRYFPKSTLAIEENLTESIVKDSMPNASVIHFATHGVYDDSQPLNSYLLLNSDVRNDGKFTVYEVFNSRTNAQLTTLSACQSSIGKISCGDEIASLSRAFLYAGSSSVISTLWNISDSATPKLIDDFYSFHHQGKSYLEALCLAQRKFIQLTNSNPSLWSAFVLYN